MSRWLPWQRRQLLLVHLLMGVIVLLDAHYDNCHSLRCLHDSPCQVISSNQVSSAACVCPDGWVGNNCQAKLHLEVRSVTMTTATLNVIAKTPYQKNTQYDFMQARSEREKRGKIYMTDENQKYDVSRHKRSSENVVQSFSYTIHYWSLDQVNACNIIPKVSTSVITLKGLARNTTYIFCAKTLSEDLCTFDLVQNVGDVTYCVALTTKNVDETVTQQVPLYYVIIVASVTAVALCVLLIILIVSIRKQYFSSLLCVDKTSSDVKRRLPKPTRSSESAGKDMHSDMWLLESTETKQNKTVNIYPPSCPGKPADRMAQKRMRGYASFAAKNEQTIALTTVIEYDPPEEIHDVDDDVITETPLDAMNLAELGTRDDIMRLDSEEE